MYDELNFHTLHFLNKAKNILTPLVRIDSKRNIYSDIYFIEIDWDDKTNLEPLFTCVHPILGDKRQVYCVKFINSITFRKEHGDYKIIDLYSKIYPNLKYILINEPYTKTLYVVQPLTRNEALQIAEKNELEISDECLNKLIDYER
jgi:hypothetical protein